MFKGRDIPSQMTIPGVLDRTLVIFRSHYFAYLVINMVTFGPAFLLAVWLVSSAQLDIDEVIDNMPYYLAPIVVLTFVFFTVPSLIADLAMQHFTSALIKEKPITWSHAIRKAFSIRLLNYTLTKILGSLATLLGTAVSFALSLLIPILGGLASSYFRLSIHSMVSGMNAAITVEEGGMPHKIIGRGIKLGWKRFFYAATSSFLGYYIMLGFIGSVFLLFISIGGTIGALIYSVDDVMIADNEKLEEFFLYLFYFTVPLIGVLIYMPLSSIFYSMLYYSLRSRREGYHLENRIDLYFEGIEETLPIEKPAAEPLVNS